MALADDSGVLTPPLLVAVLCTVAVFWSHSTKKQPDEASKLRASLWGLGFRPLGAGQQLLIAVLGILGLASLILSAAARLGPLAAALALAVASTGFRALWPLVPSSALLRRHLRLRRAARASLGETLEEMESCQGKLPVWIVTGFLGSGKTTLVNRILSQGHRLLVIQHETGETSLDAELVIQAAGEENVVLMNGCACCQIRRDLRDLLLRVRGRGVRDIDGIIIECCGLADPRAVVQTFLLDEEMKRMLQIQEVIAVIDAAHVARHLLSSRSTPATRLVEVQVAFASMLLLNKIDQCSSGDFSAICRAIKEINSTEVVPCTFCEVDPLTLLRPGRAASCGRAPWQQPGAWSPERALSEDIQLQRVSIPAQEPTPLGAEAGTSKSRPQIRCVSVRVHGSLDLDAFNRWVLRLLQDMDIMRAKGVLAVAGFDAKFAFQAVHAAFDGIVALAAKWGKDEGRFSDVVIIGFEVQADLIQHGLKRCRAA